MLCSKLHCQKGFNLILLHIRFRDYNFGIRKTVPLGPKVSTLFKVWDQGGQRSRV